MKEIITKAEILNFPKKIEEISKEYSENITLIRKSVYEQFDTKKLKEEITFLFQKFHEISYMYKFPEATSFLSSPSLERKENMRTNNINDQTGKLVEREWDAKNWATLFYEKISSLTKKLTAEETQYLLEAFFKQHSEFVISERLHISKNKLIGIKKSFLVKAKCELEDLFEKNI